MGVYIGRLCGERQKGGTLLFLELTQRIRNGGECTDATLVFLLRGEKKEERDKGVKTQESVYILVCATHIMREECCIYDCDLRREGDHMIHNKTSSLQFEFKKKEGAKFIIAGC